MIKHRKITDTVLAFLQKLIDDLPIHISQVTVYLDCSPVHKAKKLKEFAALHNLELVLLPKYSCTLNPSKLLPASFNYCLFIVEHLWALIKREWGSQLSATSVELNPRNLIPNIKKVCNIVRERLTPKMMTASDKHMASVLRGELV